MLRNRSPRAVTTKQGLMTDHSTSLISPNKNPNSSPISSFLGSPRLFNGFLSKNLSSDAEQHQLPTMSPTSILDLKNSPSFINPFGYDRSLSKTPTPSPETSNSRPGAIGLALIDSIVDKKNDGSITRTALSKLKVQIPDMNNYNNNNSSSGDFGIKTRSCQVMTSPVSEKEGLVKRQMSLREMEMSEDYTCVIIHGPNPKTKHIFDDCIVECEFAGINNYKDGGNVPGGSGSSLGFLSFCYTCREVLGQDRDIYMYRGEKAFCSHECRCQEMYLETLGNPHHPHDAF